MQSSALLLGYGYDPEPRSLRWTERLRRVKRVGRVAWGRQEYPFRADEHDAARQIIDERKSPCRHYARG